MLEMNIKSATDNKGAFENIDKGLVLDTLIYLTDSFFCCFATFKQIINIAEQ